MSERTEVSFDAALMMALRADAQRELDELPTPAQLKERYPDTSRWDARLKAALHKRCPVLKRVLVVAMTLVTLVDCKSTESKSSINFLLTDGKQYYIITAKRFFIGNRYDLSQLMPFSEGTSYSYTDCFTKVNVIQSGNKLCLDAERYVQPYILSFLFLCVVLMLNILGDKSTPEE